MNKTCGIDDLCFTKTSRILPYLYTKVDKAIKTSKQLEGQPAAIVVAMKTNTVLPIRRQRSPTSISDKHHHYHMKHLNYIATMFATFV